VSTMSTEEGGGTVPQQREMGSPPGLEMSPAFVWMEINRRVDVLTHKLERLDEHGTRGVDALRNDVARLRQDYAEHEASHKTARDDQVSGRRWLVGIFIATITPLYPLLGAAIWLAAHAHG
jgi:hypothetical protein